MTGKVTMTELSTTWSFEDLVNFNILLEMQQDIETEALNDSTRADNKARI